MCCREGFSLSETAEEHGAKRLINVGGIEEGSRGRIAGWVRWFGAGGLEEVLGLPCDQRWCPRRWGMGGLRAESLRSADVRLPWEKRVLVIRRGYGDAW
jgi:hypothetical protein